MKKFVYISTVLVLVFSMATVCVFAEVSESNLKEALSDNSLSSAEIDSMLAVETDDGKLNGKSVYVELIHKQYAIKNDGGLDKEAFCDYSGNFADEMEADASLWVVPTSENDIVIKEYFFSVSGKGKINYYDYYNVKDNIGLGFIYPLSKMVSALKNADAGTPETIKSFTMSYPTAFAGVYIQTDRGEYIIPTLSRLGNYYNKYNDDEINLTILKAVTADNFVDAYKKECAAKKRYDKEMEDKSKRSIVHVKDDNGEVIIKAPGAIQDTPVNDEEKTTQPVQKASEIDKASQSIEEPNELKKPSQSVDTLSTTEAAEKLNDLGLFYGTENGFELDKLLTREQGATMIVRLWGKEKEAIADAYEGVFTDVRKDRWSFPYVMYCLKKGITKGTGGFEFSPDIAISASEFTAMLLRSLGYEANLENAFSKAGDIKLLSGALIAALESKAEFTRGDMINIAYAAYEYKNK